jgi:putative transcriptional regulator
MSNGSTSDDKRDRYGMSPEDWKRLDAMTDEEITAAALADPDAQPISPERLAAARPPSFAKRVRHKLHMGRERFCSTYGIPLDTLRAWERHEAEPTPTELAYLRLIEREPERARMVPAE